MIVARFCCPFTDTHVHTHIILYIFFLLVIRLFKVLLETKLLNSIFVGKFK